MRFKVFLLVSLFLLPLFSCADRSAKESLEDIESYIQERPDSALASIRTIDTTRLNTRALRAKYSLLHAMALDKNYIDTTDIAVVMPAVEYYSTHGTANDKLRVYYYLGRIQGNAGDHRKAAVSFSLGEGQVTESTDAVTEALLYMAFADIYNHSRNKEKEEEYVRKGIAAFEKADDVAHSNLSAGRLAMIYYGKQEWDKADSLFRSGIEQAKEDTVAMSVFLSNYARLKVIQPNQDPIGAIQLLMDLSVSYKRPLSLTDYGVWAYAAALTGDERTCSRIVAQLEALDEPHRNTILYWLYRIEQQQGNYEKALEYNIESNANNSKTVERLLYDSIGQTLQNYYSSEASRIEREARLLRLRLLAAILGLCLLFLIFLGYFKYRRDRKEKEMDRLLKIRDEANKILSQTNNDLQRQKSEMEEEHHNLMENLRKAYVSAYKDKFAAIGDLCNAYISSNSRTDKKDYIVRRVENLIACISDDDKLHTRFETQINKDLNNIMKHLKTDLGGLDKKESRFICYCIVGFEPEMIGSILGLSVSNVYTKKSRLKERIRGIDSPYKEDYLRML